MQDFFSSDCFPVSLLRCFIGEMSHWIGKNARVKQYSFEVHYFDSLTPVLEEQSIEKHFTLAKNYVKAMKDSGLKGTEPLLPFTPKIYFPRQLHAGSNISSPLEYSQEQLKLGYFWHLFMLMGTGSSKYLVNTSMVVNNCMLFDKTPAYFDKMFPEMINAVSKSSKVLMLLRDPAKRTHSAYWHRCRRYVNYDCSAKQFRNWFFGALNLSTSLSEADLPLATAAVKIKHDQVQWRVSDLENFDDLANDKALGAETDIEFDIYAIRSIAYSLYVNYLKEWADVFGAEGNLHILFTEEFQEDPFTTLQVLETELGLPSFNFKSIAKKVRVELLICLLGWCLGGQILGHLKAFKDR